MDSMYARARKRKNGGPAASLIRSPKDQVWDLETDPYEMQADLQVIAPEDTRKRILSTTKIPFRYICKLEITRSDGVRAFCTGTLVGLNKVLTAAHCLSHKGRRATLVRVIPGKRSTGRSRQAEPFGSAMARRIQMPAGFRVAGDRFDYAVLTLRQPIGKTVGWWKRIGAWDDRRVLIRPFNTAGFPGDKHPRGDQMYWTYNRAVSVRGPRMEYLHDTFGGQSGSPLWIRWKDNRTMVGVHSDRDDPSTPVVANIGVHITPAILSDIRRWLRS